MASLFVFDMRNIFLLMSIMSTAALGIVLLFSYIIAHACNGVVNIKILLLSISTWMRLVE